MYEPGTLEARMEFLAEFTYKHTGHSRLSAQGFETSLVDYVKMLEEKVADLEAKLEQIRWITKEPPHAKF